MECGLRPFFSVACDRPPFFPFFSTKLKLYGDLHADMQAHNSVLQERKSALEGARKKLVNEGADVLK